MAENLKSPPQPGVEVSEDDGPDIHLDTGALDDIFGGLDTGGSDTKGDPFGIFATGN